MNTTFVIADIPYCFRVRMLPVQRGLSGMRYKNRDTSTYLSASSKCTTSRSQPTATLVAAEYVSFHGSILAH